MYLSGVYVRQCVPLGCLPQGVHVLLSTSGCARPAQYLRVLIAPLIPQGVDRTVDTSGWCMCRSVPQGGVCAAQYLRVLIVLCTVVYLRVLIVLCTVVYLRVFPPALPWVILPSCFNVDYSLPSLIPVSLLVDDSCIKQRCTDCSMLYTPSVPGRLFLLNVIKLIFRDVRTVSELLITECEKRGTGRCWEHLRNKPRPKGKQACFVQQSRHRKHVCTRMSGIARALFSCSKL